MYRFQRCLNLGKVLIIILSLIFFLLACLADLASPEIRCISCTRSHAIRGWCGKRKRCHCRKHLAVYLKLLSMHASSRFSLSEKKVSNTWTFVFSDVSVRLVILGWSFHAFSRYIIFFVKSDPCQCHPAFAISRKNLGNLLLRQQWTMIGKYSLFYAFKPMRNFLWCDEVKLFRRKSFRNLSLETLCHMELVTNEYALWSF